MAAKYRRIDPRIWTDEGFSELTIYEKLITFYTLTAQANRVGFFTFSPGKACEDLKMSRRVFQKAFPKVCETFGWEWDEYPRVLFIPTWWKYNHPENLRHFVGCLKDLADLPQTKLLSIFTANTKYLESYLHETLHHSSQHSYPRAIGKGQAYQEQEQEQEQESRALPPSADTADRSKRKGQLSDEEFIAALKANPAYRPLDVDMEMGKLDAWLISPRGKGKKKTRQRIIYWLNKAADDQREVKTAPHPYRGCMWKLTNGDGRHAKLCGKPASMVNGIESSHCDEHLENHLEQRRRIDAQLNRDMA